MGNLWVSKVSWRGLLSHCTFFSLGFFSLYMFSRYFPGSTSEFKTIWTLWCHHTPSELQEHSDSFDILNETTDSTKHLSGAELELLSDLTDSLGPNFEMIALSQDSKTMVRVSTKVVQNSETLGRRIIATSRDMSSSSLRSFNLCASRATPAFHISYSLFASLRVVSAEYLPPEFFTIWIQWRRAWSGQWVMSKSSSRKTTRCSYNFHGKILLSRWSIVQSKASAW